VYVYCVGITEGRSCTVKVILDENVTVPTVVRIGFNDSEENSFSFIVLPNQMVLQSNFKIYFEHSF
jgi:ADP-glucose pyrophosphorylase